MTFLTFYVTNKIFGFLYFSHMSELLITDWPGRPQSYLNPVAHVTRSYTLKGLNEDERLLTFLSIFLRHIRNLYSLSVSNMKFAAGLVVADKWPLLLE